MIEEFFFCFFGGSDCFPFQATCKLAWNKKQLIMNMIFLCLFLLLIIIIITFQGEIKW